MSQLDGGEDVRPESPSSQIPSLERAHLLQSGPVPSQLAEPSAPHGMASLGALLSRLGSLPQGLQASRVAGRMPRIQLRFSSNNGVPGGGEAASDSSDDPEQAGSTATREPPSLSRHLLRHLSRGGRGGEATAPPTTSQPDAGGADNLAAAAERHRLSNTTVVDLQATARWLEGSLCFLLLLLLVFLYNHIAGIATFAWLTLLLVKANDVLRKQVALKEQRQLSALLTVCVLVGLHVPAVLWLLQDRALWRVLAFGMPKHIDTVWDAFFVVAVVDVLARFCGMVVKVGVLLLSRTTTPEACRQRGAVLTALEHLLLLYRAALPPPVWYTYYMTRHLPALLFSCCTGLYMMFKCSALYERMGAALKALRRLGHPEGQFGTAATPEEVAESGNQCSICTDAMAKPIRLQCSHVFCEACIAEWFERERTCPMCRAVVKPAGLTSFSDCSTSLLPQLF